MKEKAVQHFLRCPSSAPSWSLNPGAKRYGREQTLQGINVGGIINADGMINAEGIINIF